MAIFHSDHKLNSELPAKSPQLSKTEVKKSSQRNTEFHSAKVNFRRLPANDNRSSPNVMAQIITGKMLEYIFGLINSKCAVSENFGSMNLRSTAEKCWVW